MKKPLAQNDYCVVAADGVNARIFTLLPPENPEQETGPRLCEVVRLRNEERELQSGEMFRSNRRGGRSAGGQTLAAEDHRTRHETVFEERFARKVGETAMHWGKTHHTHVLILAAEPHMLGLLRHELDTAPKAGLELREYNRDVTSMSPDEIQSHLVQHKLVPACDHHIPPQTRAIKFPW